MINFKFKSDKEILENPLICSVKKCKELMILNHSYSKDIEPRPLCSDHWKEVSEKDFNYSNEPIESLNRKIESVKKPFEEFIWISLKKI